MSDDRPYPKAELSDARSLVGRLLRQSAAHRWGAWRAAVAPWRAEIAVLGAGIGFWHACIVVEARDRGKASASSVMGEARDKYGKLSGATVLGLLFGGSCFGGCAAYLLAPAAPSIALAVPVAAAGYAYDVFGRRWLERGGGGGASHPPKTGPWSGSAFD